MYGRGLKFAVLFGALSLCCCATAAVDDGSRMADAANQVGKDAEVGTPIIDAALQDSVVADAALPVDAAVEVDAMSSGTGNEGEQCSVNADCGPELCCLPLLISVCVVGRILPPDTCIPIAI